jgi:hypothetical protein
MEGLLEEIERGGRKESHTEARREGGRQVSRSKQWTWGTLAGRLGTKRKGLGVRGGGATRDSGFKLKGGTVRSV